MATGYLSASGDPHLQIQIAGAWGPQHPIECLIDTGFTGFLSLPLVQAFPIGLILQSTTNVVFANGQTEVRLACLGVIELDGVHKAGLVLIESQGAQAAVGMDFLRKFEKRLIIDTTAGTVELAGAVVVPQLPAAAAPAEADSQQAPTAHVPDPESN